MRDLLFFKVLAETKSATIAAERLGITQSAVSQSVARLERWLGAALLDRSNRPIRITLAGEILWHRATDILEMVNGTAEEIRAGSNAKISLVRLGMVDSFATTVGPDVVKALQGRVEQLRVWSGISPSLCADLLDRSLDVIVSIDPMVEHPELARELIFRETLVAVVPQGVNQRFQKLSIEQICVELPLVRYSGRSSMGRMVEYYLSKRRLAPNRTLEFDASEAVLRMVATGIGWTITTPLCLLQGHGQMMDIGMMPLPPPPIYRRIYLVYRPNELGEFMSEIGRICRACVETSILPNLRKLAPWACAETAEEAPS
ncbi:MAG: LysR family transcriptional regulator [Holophaga sp.]|jgi:DNA-binding transcriptional LysR family regulator